MQCQAKASSAHDMLQLLVGRPNSDHSSAVASDADAPAAASLKGCLGAAAALIKAAEAQKKEVFDVWQVGIVK
jgi:hypothetical protein